MAGGEDGDEPRGDEKPQREPRGFAAALVGEFVGTICVTIGTIGPAAAVNALGVSLGYAVEMACTGLMTVVMIYALRHVSGAHFNPCITLGFALRGDMSWRRFGAYAVVQFAGAIAAGAIVLAILHPDREALLPQMWLGPGVAFWTEIVLTVIAALVALSTADAARFIGPESALANGGTTVVDRWIGGHLSSGSMNPARTLGPAIVVGGFSAWWVYAVAPVAGTLIAVGLVSAMWRAGTAGQERSRRRRP
jgi:aquaporin Z